MPRVSMRFAYSRTLPLNGCTTFVLLRFVPALYVRGFVRPVFAVDVFTRVVFLMFVFLLVMARVVTRVVLLLIAGLLWFGYELEVRRK